MSGRINMDLVLRLWLHDHPGGVPEDYYRASRPFNAEPGRRHKRAHHAFLEWLNQPYVQRAIFPGASDER